MNFVSREHINAYLNNLKYLGQGSQGTCYLNTKTNTVFKIFNEFYDNEDPEYTEEFLLRFSNIKNNTFVWPNDVIKVKSNVVGYTMPYKKAKNLCDTNPLLINLNSLELATKNATEDIKLITDNSIKLFDVRYNVLYSNKKIYIIDTLEYRKRIVTFNENRQNLDDEIKLFLVDDYFDDYVKENKILSEMYKDKEVSGLDFLRSFKDSLSSYLEKDVIKLNDAKSLIKKNNNSNYVRGFN